MERCNGIAMQNIEYTTNKIIHSRRLLLLSLISSFVLFIFVWQGVESLFNEVADHKNILVRIALISMLLFICGGIVLYIYITNQIEKSRVAVAYSQNLHNTLENDIKAKYESEYESKLGEVLQMIEQLEWERSRIAKTVSTDKNVSIPIDYSLDRNRLVFIQQKGNNKQTAYEYAYYEVKGAYLVIGKANFNRNVLSVSDEKDSMGRFIGTKETYLSQPIEVYIQNRLLISDIPEPYKTAIQLGALKTETVMSLAKSWGKEPNPYSEINEEKEKREEEGKENPKIIDLM